MYSHYTEQDTKPRRPWFNSGRLWQVLRDTPAHWRLSRVLMRRDTLQNPQNLGRTLAIILVLLTFTFSFPIPFLIMHYFALILVWRVAGAIAEQHELGRRDLIAITPSIGDFGLSLEICRLYWDDIIEQAGRFYRRLASFLGLGFTLLNLITLISGMARPSTVSSSFFTLILFAGLVTLWFYIEIRYGLLMAALIGMLAGSTGDRRNARTFAVGGYIALHTLMFILLIVFLGLVISVIGRSTTSFLMLLIVGFAAWGVFSVIRELVIFGLWQVLRWRLNDDVPALKMMLRQD